MRPHKAALCAATLALFALSGAVTVIGQRTSAQFSFPPPQSSNQQFGPQNPPELFAEPNGNQELSNLALSNTNSAGPQGSTFVQFSGSQPSAQQSFASSLQNPFAPSQSNHLLSQAMQVQQQQSPAQPQPSAFQPFAVNSPPPPAQPSMQLAPQLPPAPVPLAVPPQPQQQSQAQAQQPPPRAPQHQQHNHQQNQQNQQPLNHQNHNHQHQQPEQQQAGRPALALNPIDLRPQVSLSSTSRQAQATASSTVPSTTSASTTSTGSRRQSQLTRSTGSASQPATVASANAAAVAANKPQRQTPSQTNSNNQATLETARRAEAAQASLSASTQGAQSYQCPDSFGYFRHHKSCDKYWACENGTSTLKLCGNGLMFDDSDPKRENCAYPFSVDCGSDRTDLEPPISTPNCPRLYGLFSDAANCRVFYSCWNGEASKYECPPGLAYDSEQRVCVWADLVDRCDQSEVSDGFVCPDPTEADQPGHYTRHAHPTDCRKFYVCIDGVARPYGCSFGTVFNVDSLQCDEPDSVSGCEKYYGDLDPKLAKKLARENASGQSTQTNRQPATSANSNSS